MPLLPHPRELKHGKLWLAKIKLAGKWREINTHSRDKKLAQKVFDFVEAYLYEADSVKEFLSNLRGKSDAEIKRIIELHREQIKAGGNPFEGGSGKGVRVVDSYEEYMVTMIPTWKDTTVQNKRETQKKVALFFAETSLESLDTPTINRFRGYLASTLAPATVNIHLRNFRAFMREMKHKASKQWELPKVKQIQEVTDEIPDHFTPIEQGKLLIAADSWLPVRPQDWPHVGIVVRTFLYTGMRRTEVVSMKWDWLEFDYRDEEGNTRPLIHVDGKITKSKKYRAIPMDDHLVSALQSLPYIRKGRVFPFMTASGMTKLFPKLCRRAEISGLNLHKLRDTYAMNMVNRGVPEFVLMKL